MTQTNRKKLLITASTFPRWDKDTEPRFVLDLAKAMQEEFDVTVLAPAAAGAKDREELEGVKVIRYHYFPVHKLESLCYPGAIVPRIREKKARAFLVPFLFLALWWKLCRLLPEFDAVHSHWLLPQGIVQSFFRKPYVVTGHGGDVTSLNKGIPGMLKRRCLKRASAVTVVSGRLDEIVRQLYCVDKAHVISMGCDFARFGRQHFVPGYFGQGDKKVVLFVGRLVEIKGVTYLIEAMRQVDAMLAVVGDGPLMSSLKRQAGDMQDKVRFLGARTHDELAAIYASADVFVMPSVTAGDGGVEGFGLVALEAIASGLPVVACNTGGIGSLIRDGVNGLMCREKDSDELAAKIKQLLCNEGLRARLVQCAQADIADYGYGAIGRRYCRILEQALAGEGEDMASEGEDMTGEGEAMAGETMADGVEVMAGEGVVLAGACARGRAEQGERPAGSVREGVRAGIKAGVRAGGREEV